MVCGSLLEQPTTSDAVAIAEKTLALMFVCTIAVNNRKFVQSVLTDFRDVHFRQFQTLGNFLYGLWLRQIT